METQSIPTINHFSALVKLNKLTDDKVFIESICEKLINGLKLNVVKKVDIKFKPIGRTIVYILSESHLAVHTWPEFNTIHIDLLSCSDTKISDFDKVLAGILKDLNVIEYNSKAHNI